MEDYPRTLRELESRSPTEQACRDYLARLRWPQGKLFYRLLDHAVAVDPALYAAMVKGVPGLTKKRHHKG